MWSLILTGLLVASALAEPGWKAGSQYTYEVRGRMVTGIFQAQNQYSGMNTRVKLSVQPKSDNVLSLQVHGAEYAEIHANLSNGWATEIPDADLKYMQLPIKSDPWEIHLKNGVVQQMVVDKNLPSWEVNVLKAIASLLQIDTQGENLKKSKSNLIPTDEDISGVYKTMEDSIHGVYETSYEVSELPEYLMLNRPELVPVPHLQGNGKIINIVKNRNFSNSDKHIVFNYGMDGKTQWEPASNHMGNSLTRSSVSRIILTGNLKRYVIQSSVTDDKMILAPHLHNSRKGILASRMNLTLEGVSTAQGPSPPVNNPAKISSLTYEYKPRNEMNQNRQKSSDSSSSSSSSSESDEINILKMKMNKNENSMESEEMTKTGKYQSRSPSSSSSSSSSYSSSSSESSESLSSSEEYYQPLSGLEQAPHAGLLPYFTGYKGQSIQSAQELNFLQQVIQLAKEVANGIQHPEIITGESTLSQFDTLTRFIRTMSAEQYNKVTEKLYTPYSSEEQSDEKAQDYLAWVSFRDAVAECGSGPALITIKEWIKSKKVEGEEAAQIVAVLPRSARYPSSEYMRAFFEMVKDPEVQRQRFLNTSAALSFTDLVRKAMVDLRNIHNYYAVHMYGPTFGKFDDSLEDYIQHFDGKLKEAVEKGDSIKIQVFIQALGNIAHRRVLSSFKPYLEGQKPISNYQRLVMVASLGKMIQVYPEQAQAVLYRIYQNLGESPEIRTAAVMQIMKTKPSAQMLQRMAEQTNYDHSTQVNSAVKSAIESLANQPINKYNKLWVKNAKSAVNMLTTENFGVHNSRNFIKSFIVKEQNLAYKQHLSYIQSRDSILPRSAFYTLSQNLGGFKHHSHEMQYMTSSVDKLLEQLFQQFSPQSPENNKAGKNPGSEPEWSLERIYASLGFEDKISDQLEGNLLITALGGKRYFTFDNHTIEKLPNIVQMMSNAVQKGQNFNLTKLYYQYTMDMAFPTAAGFPFIYSLTLPTIISCGGKIKATLGNADMNAMKANKVYIPEILNITGAYDFIYSLKRQGKFGFSTPFNSKAYFSGIEKNLQVHVPLRASAIIDLKNAGLSASIEPVDEKRKQKIVELSSDAYTSSQSVLETTPPKKNKNTHFIHSKKPSSNAMTVGLNSHGFAFDINVEGGYSTSGLQKVYERISNYDLISFWLYSDMDEESSNNNITLTHNPDKSWAKKLGISIQYSSNKGSKISGSEKPNNVKYMRGTYTENLAVPSSSDQKQRQQEMLNNVMSGMEQSEGKMVDMSISSEGLKKAEYVISLAYASSPVNDNSRFLAFFGNYSSSQSSKPYLAGLQMNMKSTKVPLINYHDALNANPKIDVNARLDMGSPSSMEAQVIFKGELKSSPERKQHLKQHPLSAVCEKQMQSGQIIQPACRNMTARAGYLDSYQFTLSYQKLPAEMKNLTYLAYSAARCLGYPYHQENALKGASKEGQVEVDIKFSKSLRKVNVTLLSPSLSAKFERVPIHEWLRPILVIHPRYGAFERLGQKMLQAQQSPICVLDGDTMNTFDNRSYHVNIGNANYILAQSFFNYSQLQKLNMIQQNNDYFSIMVRRYSENQLKLIIIDDDYSLEIQPNGKPDKFVFNGENVSVKEGGSTQLSDKQGSVIFEVFSEPNEAYQISSKKHDFEIIYTGNSIHLQISNSYRGKIRGLCGTFDGESYNDLMTPSGYILNSTELFVSSYVLADLYTGDSPRQTQLQESGVREEIVLGNVVSEEDPGKLIEKKISKKSHAKIHEDMGNEDSSETYYRVKIVQEPGKTCFSLKPQLSCGSNFKASKMIDKTIDFHCVQNSSASKHWEAMVKKGANPDFTQKGSNHRATLKLPEQCVQI